MSTPTPICCPPVTEAALNLESAQRLANVFATLADPVRLQLLSMVACQPQGSCACDFVAPLKRSQPTISHHLKILHQAGLLTRERRGRWIWYPARPEALNEAAALLNC